MLTSLGWTTLRTIARLLPVRLGYTIARAGARLHYHCAPSRRAAVTANLARALAFARQDGHRQRAAAWPSPSDLARATFESHGALLFEWLRAGGGARFPVRIDGCEHIDQALDGGRGAILVTCHLGNWEVAAAELAASGYPLTVVTGEQLGRLAPAVRRDKARRGIAVVRPVDGMRSLYRQLASNRIIALLIDGDVFQQGNPVDFLGAPAHLPWGAVRLARATGAALLPATMRRVAPAEFHASIHAPVKPGADSASAMRQLLAPLETAIAADPTQWCLFRPLWSAAPERHTRGRLDVTMQRAAQDTRGWA